jgi:SAM-dependent methyltransferase
MKARLARLRRAWLQTGHRQRLTRALVPRISSLDGRILDVGGGRAAPHDDAWKPDVWRVRVDLSAAHGPTLQGDVARLPFADGTFDGAVMFELLEHVPDPATAVAEVRRVLRPGARFLGSAPFVWPIHGDPNDYFRFSADGLRTLLRGFSDIRILPLGNAVGSAWLLLSSGSRALRLFNPVLRRLGERPDPRAPEGYVFTATR